MRRRAPNRGTVPERLNGRRDSAGQASTSQRLHDDDVDAARLRILKPLEARLERSIEVVVLNLAKLPAALVDDLLEGRQLVVEREARVPDLARHLGPPEEVERTHLPAFLPAAGAEGVEQIEVDPIGVEPFQLEVETSIEVGRILHQPDRRLGGDEGSVAVAVLERLADDSLALAVVIHPRGVEVVDAVVDGVAQQAHRLGHVHGAVRRRQSHRPKAELRDAFAGE